MGVTTYHGDLNDLFYDKLGAATSYSLGMGLSKKIGSQFSLRLDFTYYNISGSDAASGFLNGKDSDRRKGDRDGQSDTRFIRNLSFSATNLEMSVLGIFHLIPEKRYFVRRSKINPYIMLGIGFTTNNPKGRHPIEGKVNLRKLNTEALSSGGYAGILFVVPVGFGIRFKANRFIDILVEGGRRFTFSDYLDDVSTTYPGRDALLAAGRRGSSDQALVLFDRSAEAGYPVRKAGNTRGNPDNNDAYYIFQVRLEMYLPYEFFKNFLKSKNYKPKFR